MKQMILDIERRADGSMALSAWGIDDLNDRQWLVDRLRIILDRWDDPLHQSNIITLH